MMKQQIAISTSFQGAPTFIRILCSEASRGGADSYFFVGRELGGRTPALLEPQDHPEIVQRKLDELRILLDRDYRQGVVAWYVREFPGCMSLVPRRRHPQFVKGVVAVDEKQCITDF